MSIPVKMIDINDKDAPGILDLDVDEFTYVQSVPQVGDEIVVVVGQPNEEDEDKPKVVKFGKVRKVSHVFYDFSDVKNLFSQGVVVTYELLNKGTVQEKESVPDPDYEPSEEEQYTTIDGHEGDLMTVEEFKDACEDGCFIDYDGMGDMVKDGHIVVVDPDSNFFGNWVKPSTRHLIPDDITHILWYNN